MDVKQDMLSAGSTQTDAAELAGRKQPSVLLVEDDRSLRRYLEVTLLRSGYRVITAEDGLDAMKHALSSQIDVVITDAIMPHLSGVELARFLRSNPKLSHLPIIMLTGQENRKPTAAADNLIDAFLYKPVRAEELRKCLAELVQESRPSNESSQDQLI